VHGTDGEPPATVSVRASESVPTELDRERARAVLRAKGLLPAVKRRSR
jgi:hypothetical protein